MTAVSPARRQKLGLVHTLAADAGLDEDARRDKLQLITGHRSAKDCSDDELDRFIASFHVKQKAHTSSYSAKVKALWIACWNLALLDAGDDRALDAFVKRQTGKERLTFLTAGDANRVSEALKAMLSRAGCEVPSGDEGGMAARRHLVVAQWIALNGVTRADYDRDLKWKWALETALERIAGTRHQGLLHFTAQQLDTGARELGRRLRRKSKSVPPREAGAA